MKTVIKIAIAALVAATVSDTAVLAQGKGRLAACKADIDKYCASEPRGQGKVRACLDANKDKLAADCKTALDKATQ